MCFVPVVHLGAHSRVGGVLGGSLCALGPVCAANPSYFYLPLSALWKLYYVLVLLRLCKIRWAD